jgi:uncharacterized protein YecE (DUF72 family)
MSGRIWVGTSSWADPGFVEEWYPPELPARDRLGWYAERFEAVEVNSTFYAVPEERTVARWALQTPPGFTFDIKLHRLLSRHAAELSSLPPSLREQAETNERGRVALTAELEAALIDSILEAVAPLEDASKLATFLLQLSPAFAPRSHELDELAPLIERFSPRPVAVELRHRGWVEDARLERTLGWLEQHGAAFVSVDGPDADAPTVMPAIDAVTRGDVAYLRAHGRNAQGYLHGRSVAERFAYQYSDSELGEIIDRVQVLAEDALNVHVMFNNNRGADAPTSARRARVLLHQDPGPPPEPAQQRLLA